MNMEKYVKPIAEDVEHFVNYRRAYARWKVEL